MTSKPEPKSLPEYMKIKLKDELSNISIYDPRAANLISKVIKGKSMMNEIRYYNPPTLAMTLYLMDGTKPEQMFENEKRNKVVASYLTGTKEINITDKANLFRYARVIDKYGY